MSPTQSELSRAGDRISTDFRSLAAHAEALLQATRSATGDSVEVARKKLNDSLTQARDYLGEEETALLARGRQISANTANYVREHPWPVIASALALGVAIGLISGRSGTD